jgi:DNA primase
MDVEPLKATPILEVAAGLGLRAVGRRIACPAHQLGDGVDAHPSCALYPASNRFYCFACGNRGDVIDLVAQVRGAGFAEAVAWLGDMTPGAVLAHAAPAPRVARGARVAALTDLLAACGPPSDEARRYWQRRGVSDDTLAACGLTDVKGRHTEAGLAGSRTLEELVEVGVLSRRGRLRFAEHRLLLPFWEEGAPVYLQGRRYGGAEPRYLSVNGPIPCLYNVAALDADEVWVAEGLMDTLTLATAGVAAVGLVGARGLKEAWLPLFRDKAVVVALDNDAAGRAATEAVVRRLAPYARALRVAVLPEGADVNAYYCAQRQLPGCRPVEF